MAEVDGLMWGSGEVTVDMKGEDLYLETGEGAKGRLEHLQDPLMTPDLKLPMSNHSFKLLHSLILRTTTALPPSYKTKS